MNHNLRTTHPVSRWFALALLSLFIGSMQTQAQTSVNLCANQALNVAWFGIDADLYANSPNDPNFYNSDDWFFDASVVSPGNDQGIGVISEGLSQSMSSSGEPLFQATAAQFRNYLVTATSVVNRNVRFEERMVVPTFFGRVQNGDTIVYLDAVAGRDNFSTSATLDSSMFAGNGNKNGDNPATWSLGVGNVPQKNDLVDVGGHIRYLIENGAPKLYGYAFASRLETNGDNHVDFEILREPFVSFNPANGHPINTGSPLTGGHNVGYTDATGFTTRAGDVLVAIDYDNGGTNPTYSVRVWVKPDSLGTGINSFASFNDTIAHPNVPFLFTGVFDSGIGANGYGYAEIRPRRASTAQCLVYAQTNSITTTKGTPWGNIINPGANFTNDIQQLQLISCAIDFTEFGLDATRFSNGAECANLFGSLLVKTRSSTSFTASLKDYAGPYLFGNFSSLNVTATGGTVTCSAPTATLNAVITGVNPAAATIVWSGPGAILSGQGTNSVTVNAPGTYTVAVTDLSFSNCTRYATATVVADTCRPTVSAANDGPITCTNTSRTISATASACDASSLSYSWSTGSTSSSFSTTNAGTYSVTVTQAGNGCSASASTTLGQNITNPSVTCSPGADITCANTSSTISASATASAGNTISGYSWSPGGATTASISVNNGDTYTVTVTQSNGCTSTCSSAVPVDTCKPSVSPSNNGPITCTNPTRTVSANGTACAGNTLSYSWSPSGSGASFATGNAATYTVTVTQSVNGCTASGSTSLAVDTCKPTVAPSNNGPITCTNPSRTVTANGTACTGNTLSYSWSPSGSGASFATSNAATYTVTVTQSVNGCTASGSTSLAVDTCKPTVAPSNNGPITCTNPSRTVSANGTACTGETLSYSWSPSGSGASFNTGTAGTYTVTVTQSINGCTASGSTTLTTNNSNPTVNCVPGADITCANTTSSITANATATGGNTITGYAWTPGGASTPSITVNNGNTYTVVVTQSNGCTATCNSAVAVDTCKPSVSPSNNGPITCTNPTRTVSANGTACAGNTLSYSWSPSGSGASFATGNAATYTVTVTQSVNGCTASGSTSLAVDTCKPSVTASNNGPITCTNPSRTVSSAATACDGSTLSYTWSNGSTNASFSTSTAGTYSVTVTQAGNGCSASDNTTLGSNNTNPTVNCVPGANITCTSATSSIAANATASSGNTITGYAWTPGGSTNSSITVNNGDTYTVVVTQSNGCTATCNSAVVVDTCRPSVTASNNGPITCTNPTRTVSANATACTGKAIASYAWTPSGSGASFTTGSAGTYTVTVTQTVNGCTASASTTLGLNNTPPTVQCTPGATITCANTTSTITAAGTTTGGNSAVGYSWSPSGATTASITVNNGSPYTVTFTQSNGCTATCSSSVAVDTCRPSVSPSNNGPITCTNPTRTVSANATACTGKTIASYSWTPSGSGASFTTGDAANYCVTVTQSGNGCTASACTNLAVDTCKPSVTASNDGPITCTNPSRTVSAAATACTGKSITSYAWTPSGSGASFATTVAGNYCVTVTQSVNGCTASACTNLTEDKVTPSCSISGPLSATCGSTGNTVTATVTDAQTGATYNWVVVSGTGYAVTGNGTATLTYTAGTGAGVFELTVTNPNGCSSTCSVSVDALCGRFCTYTQGGYGNGMGMRCDGTRTSAFVTTLLATPLTIGSTSTGNYITFNQSDAACLIQRMPGGGRAALLNGVATCTNPTGISIRNGRFANVLLGQTIALGLNIRINGGVLASLPITGAYFTTFAGSGSGCGSQGTATPGTGQTYSIPQAVIDYLNANTAIYPAGATVGNVFQLASDVLGRVALPGTVPTLSQLTGACGAFNEGFDGCRILGSFSATAPASSRFVTIDENGNADVMIATGVSAKVFPNPFATTTTIEFVLADYSNDVTVEIFSLSGEKVASLFKGEVNGGEVKRIEFNGAELANGIYVYRITSTDRTFYDKLILNK